MDLTPSQIATLEKLLQAGFHFVARERYARYFGIERDGFVILIDPAGGELRMFGQAGYLIGDGIGMLIKRGGQQAFVWHDQSVPATPGLLASYECFRTEVEHLLRAE